MTASSHVIDAPSTAEQNVLRVVAGGLWLLVSAAALWGASVTSDGESWVRPYTALAASLGVASALTLWAAIDATHPGPGQGSRIGRVGAVAVAVVGCAIAFVVAWAYVLWAVVQGVGHLALAATGRPGSRWVAGLGVVLLAGVGLAVLGVSLEVGDAGSEGDHGQVQGWAMALSAAAMATTLGWRGLGDTRRQP